MKLYKLIKSLSPLTALIAIFFFMSFSLSANSNTFNNSGSESKTEEIKLFKDPKFIDATANILRGGIIIVPDTLSSSNSQDIVLVSQEKYIQESDRLEEIRLIAEQERLEQEELSSWVNPLSSGAFRSSFGWRSAFEDVPAEFHNGIDLSADLGTPIVASHSGVVVAAGTDVEGWEAGIIVLKHETVLGTWYSLYYHMSSDGILVKEGNKVEVGQTIAMVGNEGRSTGPHLHFCIIKPESETQEWFDGEYIDPIPFLLGRGILIQN